MLFGDGVLRGANLAAVRPHFSFETDRGLIPGQQVPPPFEYQSAATLQVEARPTSCHDDGRRLSFSRDQGGPPPAAAITSAASRK